MEKKWNPEIDELTGLYNRSAFYRHAKQMMDEQPDVDYMIILSDIESFKAINIRYGEEKGDELLSYVGRTLGAMNGNGALFGRYSGDQFVGLLRKAENQSMDDFSPMMLSMQEMYKNAPIDRFEVKFGIYDSVEKGVPVSILCDRTMMALRTIKHQYGKYVALYDQRMRQKFLKEQRIRDCMDAALEEKQFDVYYQPKHDASTGKLVGAEALVRWNHPEYGFMSPAEFLPLFEQNGFISSLDKYVYQRVVSDQNRWVEKGLKIVPVSVNVSRVDILHENFLEAVSGEIENGHVSPEMLHMEITETVFIEDIRVLKPIISKVRELGICIELDDFGSGFSALSLLTSLPFDIIKLDKIFIDDLKNQHIVVANIIKLCHDLGFKLTAEGVETEEQLTELINMNCDTIQGYYFSKPLPADGFEEYIRNYSF